MFGKMGRIQVKMKEVIKNVGIEMKLPEGFQGLKYRRTNN